MPTEPLSILGLSEPVFRIGIFLAAFAVFSALEAVFPKRVRSQYRLERWATNGGMLVVATVLVRGLALLAPLLAITLAAGLAHRLGWGVFNLVELPFWVEVFLVIMLLDLAIWFQHLISHKVPVLWRLHRVHHADRDLDASSALRFHPIEIALSAAYKLGVVLLLGPAILAAILFEVVLNASAMFNHANLSMPRWFDRVLRSVLVTPDMHRIHHSIHRHEHNTNFGFCLSIWDRVFGTYTDEPQDGQAEMTIGLEKYQITDTSRLRWGLFLPFRS